MPALVVVLLVGLLWEDVLGAAWQEGEGDEEVQRLEGLGWVQLALSHPASLHSEVVLQVCGACVLELEDVELESGMD